MRCKLVIHGKIEKDFIGWSAYLISMGREEWNYGISDISWRWRRLAA
jgi:hypothetical protein